MEQYKQDFIEFLVEAEALLFGQFTLKSGRQAPYFFNVGSFHTGKHLSRLGKYYAEALMASGLQCDVLFGPAYKGIPLCTSTAVALFEHFQKDVSYAFNRKEAKIYGMKDAIVGAKFSTHSNVVLLDDVVTAGTAIRESVDILKNNGNPALQGIVIALDRMEKNNEGENALFQLEKDLSIRVYSIVTIAEVVKHLYGRTLHGKVYIDDEKMNLIDLYRRQYGI